MGSKEGISPLCLHASVVWLELPAINESWLLNSTTEAQRTRYFIYSKE